MLATAFRLMMIMPIFAAILFRHFHAATCQPIFAFTAFAADYAAFAISLLFIFQAFSPPFIFADIFADCFPMPVSFSRYAMPPF
jgi:hypothetical protein